MRLRVDVSKNVITAASSQEGEFVTSTTTDAPFSASASPSPVMELTPDLGDAATASCPRSRSLLTSFDPISPLPPITTIFIIAPSFSTEPFHNCRSYQLRRNIPSSGVLLSSRFGLPQRWTWRSLFSHPWKDGLRRWAAKSLAQNGRREHYCKPREVGISSGNQAPTRCAFPAASSKRPNQKWPGITAEPFSHYFCRATSDWVLTFVVTNPHHDLNFRMARDTRRTRIGVRRFACGRLKFLWIFCRL